MSFSDKKQTNVAADANGKDKTTTTPPGGASIDSDKTDSENLAKPVTGSLENLDLPLGSGSSNPIFDLISDYEEDTKEKSAKVKLATASTSFKSALFKTTEYDLAFDQEVKSLLQHTAKCDYSIHVLEDEKAIDIKEGVLYLKKNPDGLLQYQFIPPDAKEPKKPKIGTITQADLKDEIDEDIGHTAYPIPERLTNDNVQQLLPKIFKVTNYVPLLKAEQMAKQNYALILSKSVFTEEWCCQRKWKKTPLSALQYAAWAGDTELVDKFLSLLPKDEELKKEALRQLKEVKDGKLGHDRGHLSAVNDLKNGYQEYDRLYKVEEAKGVMNWDQLDVDCVNNVGKNQLRSVVNLLQWYCSSTPFADSRQNNQPPMFGKYLEARSLALWDGVLLNLLSGGGGFGSTWSIYKGGVSQAQWDRRCRGPRWIAVDFAAVSRYCEVRTNDLNRQIKQLEAELKHQPVDQKQVEKPPQLKR